MTRTIELVHCHLASYRHRLIDPPESLGMLEYYLEAGSGDEYARPGRWHGHRVLVITSESRHFTMLYHGNKRLEDVRDHGNRTYGDDGIVPFHYFVAIDDLIRECVLLGPLGLCRTE